MIKNLYSGLLKTSTKQLYNILINRKMIFVCISETFFHTLFYKLTSYSLSNLSNDNIQICICQMLKIGLKWWCLVVGCLWQLVHGFTQWHLHQYNENQLRTTNRSYNNSIQQLKEQIMQSLGHET